MLEEQIKTAKKIHGFWKKEKAQRREEARVIPIEEKEFDKRDEFADILVGFYP